LLLEEQEDITDARTLAVKDQTDAYADLTERM